MGIVDDWWTPVLDRFARLPHDPTAADIGREALLLGTQRGTRTGLHLVLRRALNGGGRRGKSPRSMGQHANTQAVAWTRNPGMPCSTSPGTPLTGLSLTGRQNRYVCGVGAY